MPLRWLYRVALGAVLLLGWLTLAPLSRGGGTSYVIVNGISMLPHYRAGGLVLIRRESSYRVGEVIAYHNAQLHEVVMHRLVVREGHRFVFKGDNNSFEDPYHASAADLVGVERVYLPGVGRAVETLHQPIFFAVVLGALGIYSSRAYLPRRSRRRRRHHGY
jgi:signal peptidase I